MATAAERQRLTRSRRKRGVMPGWKRVTVRRCDASRRNSNESFYRLGDGLAICGGGTLKATRGYFLKICLGNTEAQGDQFCYLLLSDAELSYTSVAGISGHFATSLLFCFK